MADTLTHSMHVEVISPDGPIFSEDNVDMVVARAEDGEFAVLKNHLPLAAALEMCVVRIKKAAEEEKSMLRKKAISETVEEAMTEVIDKEGFGVDDKDFAKIIAKRVA